ncbi:MAG: trigger factor [Nitrospirae bacterium RBG_13_39_12]|nr:MAG: trigger factor [Nitrospirae bacterium RBG_13_39_12]
MYFKLNKTKEDELLKSVEDINATKKRLKIEIPSDVIEKEIEDSLKKVRQKAKIPGFRPGKAPVNLIEKRFGKEVEAEVLDKIIPEYFSRALKEAELMPVTMPVVDERLDFKRNNPINISITVEVMPKVENINYENIEVKDFPVDVDVTDMDIYIKRLQEEKAVYEVAEKAVEMNDLVSFEYLDCNVAGEESDSSLKEQVSKMGNEIFPLDIMEKVMGKKKGESIEFTTTFDDNYKTKELAGKKVDIKVMISEVKRKNLPEIDDDFAKDIGFENIDEMKGKIEEKIRALKKEHAARLQKAEILSKILEPHDFEVPETLLERELESLVMQESLSQKKSGETTPETDSFEKGKAGATPSQEDLDKLRTELKEKALKNVRASIIVETIGQKEKITVTDEELNDRISLIAQRLSTTPETVRNFYNYKEGSLEGLKHSIFEDKVMDLLLSKAAVKKGE